mgnify:CR=1 FL=1
MRDDLRRRDRAQRVQVEREQAPDGERGSAGREPRVDRLPASSECGCAAPDWRATNTTRRRSILALGRIEAPSRGLLDIEYAQPRRARQRHHELRARGGIAQAM